MKNALVLIGKLKPLYRWGGLGGVAVIIMAIYFIAIYLPHQSRMQEMSDQWTQKKAEFSSMVVLVRDRGQFMEEVENLDRELKVAISMLPDKKEIPSLLKKISEEAEKFGLEVYFFEPMNEVPQGFYAAVPVSIKLKGSYHEVLSFFDTINKLARIVNISDITLKSDPNQLTKDQNKKKTTVTESAFSAFQPNKTELDVTFKATTYRFLATTEMGGGNAAKK